MAALLCSLLPLFLVFYSCPLPSLGSCDISLIGIIASSPMQYKCLSLSFPPSLSLSFSFFSTSFPFAQKKRKKEPDEPPTTSQFPGMTRMFVPHRLPFAFHLRDRLSSWPSPLLLLLLPFPLLNSFPPVFVPKVCRWVLQRVRKLFSIVFLWHSFVFYFFHSAFLFSILYAYL